LNDDESLQTNLNDDESLQTNLNDDSINKSEDIETAKSKVDGKVRFLLEGDENDDKLTEFTKSSSSQIQNKPDQDKKIESKHLTEDRIERIRKATEKLRSPMGLNEMESEPAYKRRNIDLKDVNRSDEQIDSKYTLWENINENGDKETGLSDNNSFLHDNVD
jgi:hypothetical protein